jgi:hypothetical protein
MSLRELAILLLQQQLCCFVTIDILILFFPVFSFSPSPRFSLFHFFLPPRCFPLTCASRISPPVALGVSQSAVWTTVSGFSSGTDGWVGVNVTTRCSPLVLLGGAGVLGGNRFVNRTYTDLPAHNFIVARARTMYFGTWDQDYQRLFLDDRLIGETGPYVESRLVVSP